MRILLGLRLHEAAVLRIIRAVVRRRIKRHIRGHLLVEVTVIEVHTVILVVVNLLSLLAIVLSLLRASLVAISLGTVFLPPFLCWLLSGPAILLMLLVLSELGLSMRESAPCSLHASTFLETVANLGLIESANEFS